MSFHSRGLLSAGPSRKRKEPSAHYDVKPSTPRTGEPPVSSNRLLAGYMAYEFLTKGTILGRKFDPARGEPSPSSPATWKKAKTGAEEPSETKKEHQSYSEVASILKTDGAHIPGVVNPSQLARWLQK